MRVTVEWGGQWADDVERLLAGLEEWFGMEESNRGYVESARTLPRLAALVDGEVVGVCLVRHHNPESAEIELLAVRRDLHRQGVGRRLVQHLERELRERDVKLLQVKTFGPSGSSVEYERTRAFYLSMGFIPLEERTDIWDENNPCLISVKPLS